MRWCSSNFKKKPLWAIFSVVVVFSSLLAHQAEFVRSSGINIFYGLEAIFGPFVLTVHHIDISWCEKIVWRDDEVNGPWAQVLDSRSNPSEISHLRIDVVVVVVFCVSQIREPVILVYYVLPLKAQSSEISWATWKLHRLHQIKIEIGSKL